MKKYLFALTAILALAGCAGMGGNEAYSEAHKAAERRGIVEANAAAKASETIALGIASAAKGCESDACRMGAMMSYASIKAQVESVAKTVQPVIAAPVNEALEWTKTIVGAATNIYSIRMGAAIKLGDMSRGAADKDVLNNALSTVDIIRNTDTAK